MKRTFQGVAFGLVAVAGAVVLALPTGASPVHAQRGGCPPTIGCPTEPTPSSTPPTPSATPEPTQPPPEVSPAQLTPTPTPGDPLATIAARPIASATPNTPAPTAPTSAPTSVPTSPNTGGGVPTIPPTNPGTGASPSTPQVPSAGDIPVVLPVRTPAAQPAAPAAGSGLFMGREKETLALGLLALAFGAYGSGLVAIRAGVRRK